MAFGWEGGKVRLVPLDVDRHLDNYVRWLNDPQVTRWMLVGDLPLTRLAERDYLEQAGRGSDTELIFAIETLDGEHIGGSGMHRIDYRHGTAITGTFIGRTDLWRQGYGLDSVQVRTRYAFDVLGLRLLRSEAFADNAGSVRMLQRAGYREVGRIPQRWWKRGGYRDEIIFVLLREEWRARQARP